jgi:hypothetical protein
MLADAVFALSCAILPGFAQDGAARTFNTETLYEYMNGNSEGYFLYGFSQMRGLTCKKDALKVVLDVSEFKEPELAYGMFTGNLDPRQPRTKIGAGGQVLPTKVVFVKDRFYVELSVESTNDHAALLTAAARALDKEIPGIADPPAEIGWFAQAGLQPGFPRLVPQSVLGLRMLKRGYIAQYEQGKAFFVAEASPEAAAELVKKLKERFAPAGEAKIGDEAWLAEDRYLGKMCLFRKGRRIGGYTNAAGDPAALAATLAAALP